VNLKDRQAVGRKVAGLVMQAERDMRGAPGWRKRQWVMAQARADLDLDDPDPSAAFARWFGGFLLRVAVEVACAMLDELQVSVEDQIDE